MASNYEVNIKLNTRTVNKQLNNLEKRISKLNKLAQGGRASKTVLSNEKAKLKSATERLKIEIKNTVEQKKQTLEKQKQLKLEKQSVNTRNRRRTGGGGVLSGALISGAFPLLFGQGPLGAAAGFTGG